MIELKSVELNSKYAKKWNANSLCYDNIYVDGVKKSDTLYRIGGMHTNTTDRYFMLLKYIEEFYSDEITTEKKRKPHLAGHWCILDQNGDEKVVVDQFKYPYIAGGVVYGLDNRYYNIETNELYCVSYSHFTSNEFIFLDNRYDRDKTRRGVWKINKENGTYKIYR